MLKDMVEHEFPIVLGRDFSGVVERAGSEVRGLSESDEVFGFVPAMGPTVHNGSWAELIAVPESVATRKPDDIDAASAGAAPLASITALTAMDALGVSEGHTLLIVGANAGVGSFAVQLADEAGAKVIAPALPEDEEYLRELGVSEVIDRDADVAALVHERYPEGIEASGEVRVTVMMSLCVCVIHGYPPFFLPTEQPTPPGPPLCAPLSTWGGGPGLAPLLPPLPQPSQKLPKWFHLLQVGISKPTHLALPDRIRARHALLLLRERSRLTLILESRNGRSQAWKMVEDEARESPMKFLGYRTIRRGSGGPQKLFSSLRGGVGSLFTIDTEDDEIACVLLLKIPQRTHPWRDTVKGKEKEGGGPYPSSPRLLARIIHERSGLLRLVCAEADRYPRKAANRPHIDSNHSKSRSPYSSTKLGFVNNPG